MGCFRSWEIFWGECFLVNFIGLWVGSKGFFGCNRLVFWLNDLIVGEYFSYKLRILSFVKVFFNFVGLFWGGFGEFLNLCIL